MEKLEIVEVTKYRNNLLRRLREELIELGMAENNLLLTPEREIRIKRIKDLRMLLDQIEERFKEVGTFPSKGFATFLAKFFTLTKSQTIKSYQAAEYRNGTLEEFHVVCSPDTLELLSETVQTSKDFENFLRIEQPENIIRVTGETVYPFKENSRMNSIYGNNKRLKYAIYELMQLKIDNPDITDEERYQIVLANTAARIDKSRTETTK